MAPTDEVTTPPTPGTPDGCEGYWRQSLWLGSSKESTLPVHPCKVWISKASHESGADPMVMRVYVDGKTARLISTQRASRGIPREVMDMLRALQEAGHSAGDIFREITKRGGVVERPVVVGEDGKATLAEPEPYVTKSAKPAMWRNVWNAAQKLSLLIADPDHDDLPGAITKGKRLENGDRAGIRLTMVAQLALITKGSGGRVEWFESLTRQQRVDMAVLVKNRATELVTDPPEWPWWVGKVTRYNDRDFHVPRNFIEVGYTSNIQVRTGVSYAGGPSCLRTLARLWVGPATSMARELGIDAKTKNTQQVELF